MTEIFYLNSQTAKEVTLDNPFDFAWPDQCTYEITDSTKTLATMPGGSSITLNWDGTEF